MITHTILEGDVMDGLRTLPDGCVQCTVTSPPYFALRDYGVDGQIGLEATPEEFIETMVRVFREVRRVTRPDGVLWLNLGDSYSGSSSSKGAVVNKNSLSAGSGQDVGYRDKPLGIVEGYKAKDLMGIPWKVAFALQADGWYLRSAIPWIKRNCMPESTTDRPTSAIEYVFLMAKSAKYFYDGEAVRMPIATATVKRASGKNNAENRKDGGEAVWQGGLTPEQQDKYYSNITTESTRNYRNSDPFFESWQGLYSESENPLAFIINPQARPDLHFATFPDLLAETCIKAGTSEYGCCPKCGAPYQRIVECSGGTTGKSWHPHADDGVTGQIGGMPTEGYTRQFKGWQPTCKCGEIERSPCLVLDPFMGSGTVAVVARELNRSSVGCELNPEYVKIIRKRLNIDSQLNTGVVSYHFKKVGATS